MTVEQITRRFGAARRAVVVAAAATGIALAASFATADGAAAVRATSRPGQPSGFHTVKMQKAGFSIAVPDGWLALDPTSKSLESMLRRVKAANPNLDLSVEDFRSMSSDIVLWVQNLDGEGNLLVVPLPLDQSELEDPHAVESAMGKEFSEQFSDLKVRTTTVARRHGLVGTATGTTNDLTGTAVAVKVTFYLLPDKGNGVLMFDANISGDGTQDSVVATMMRSLKWLR